MQLIQKRERERANLYDYKRTVKSVYMFGLLVCRLASFSFNHYSTCCAVIGNSSTK